VAACLGPLVARYGLRGAAWSLLAGAVVELSAYVVLTVRDLRPAGAAPGLISAGLPEGAQS
jgi:hypothetical protein